jgi:hypothetical protein
MLMLKSYPARAFLVLSLLVSVACAARAQQPDLKNLASRVSQELILEQAKRTSPLRIAVGDLTRKPKGLSALGVAIGDQLARELSAAPGTLQIIDRAILRSRLVSVGISSLGLNDRDFAMWASREVGADVVLLGEFAASEKSLSIHIEVIRVDDEKKTASFRGALPLGDELRNLLDREPEPGDRRPDLANFCGPVPRSQSKDGSYTPTACTKCVSPQYSLNERMQLRDSGISVVYIVGADGRVREAHSIRRAPAGLEVRAIRAVRESTFRPATRNGVPVAVCGLLDVSFR